jgi:sporulation protein YlmC with PRC-barrel domain
VLTATLRLVPAFALLLCVLDFAGAQTVVRAPRSVLGSRVLVQGGTSVGTVEDIVLSDEGVVDYLIVSNRGKMVTVPWDVAKFDYEKRVINVPVTEEVYQKVPTYTSEKYPNFYTPDYRAEVYRYYGVTPGAMRRLERGLPRRP